METRINGNDQQHADRVLKTNEFVNESKSVYNSIQNQKLNKVDLIQKLTYKRTAINSIGWGTDVTKVTNLNLYVM